MEANHRLGERRLVDRDDCGPMGAMMQGGRNYRELREIIHILRELGRELKKAAKEFFEYDSDKRR